MSASPGVEARGWLALSSLVVCVAAGLRLFWLESWAVAVGTDAYYYVVQIQSLERSGSLYFKTIFFLPFPVLAGLGAVTGNPVLALNVGSVLAVAVLDFVGIVIVWRWTGNGAAACFAALLLSCSSLVTPLTVDFVANAYGMLAYATMVLALLNSETDPRRRSAWYVVLALVACLLTHLSAVVVAMTTLIALVAFAAYRQLRHSDVSIPTVLGGALVVFCTLGILLVARDSRARLWAETLSVTGPGTWSLYRP